MGPVRLIDNSAAVAVADDVAAADAATAVLRQPERSAEPMRRRMMKSKIHRATVTDANLDYVGRSASTPS